MWEECFGHDLSCIKPLPGDGGDGGLVARPPSAGAARGVGIFSIAMREYFFYFLFFARYLFSIVAMREYFLSKILKKTTARNAVVTRSGEVKRRNDT